MGEKGIGMEDTLFITNEEWITYDPNVETFVGLSSHAIVSDLLHDKLKQVLTFSLMKFTSATFLHAESSHWC